MTYVPQSLHETHKWWIDPTNQPTTRCKNCGCKAYHQQFRSPGGFVTDEAAAECPASKPKIFVIRKRKKPR